MTEKSAKNVAGPFYVDAECIGCGMCHEIGTEFFLIDDEDGTAYVAKQPANEEDKAVCEEAMTSCPVEAIHDDGE